MIIAEAATSEGDQGRCGGDGGGGETCGYGGGGRGGVGGTEREEAPPECSTRDDGESHGARVGSWLW